MPLTVFVSQYECNFSKQRETRKLGANGSSRYGLFRRLVVGKLSLYSEKATEFKKNVSKIFVEEFTFI